MYYTILLDAEDLKRIEEALEMHRQTARDKYHYTTAASMADTLRRIKEQGDEQRSPK